MRRDGRSIDQALSLKRWCEEEGRNGNLDYSASYTYTPSGQSSKSYLTHTTQTLPPCTLSYAKEERCLQGLYQVQEAESATRRINTERRSSSTSCVRREIVRRTFSFPRVAFPRFQHDPKGGDVHSEHCVRRELRRECFHFRETILLLRGT